MKNLKDFTPVIKTSDNLVQVPTFIQGNLKGTFMPEYEKARQKNKNFAFEAYSSQKDVLFGSNVFMTGLTNWVFAQAGANFRTPVPTDKIYQNIFPMIKDNFYLDLNAFDVWSEEPSNKKNKTLWQQVRELARENLGEIPKETFRVQGFYCIPNPSVNDYGVEIKPAKNFRIIESKNLNLPTGTNFNSIDSKGMVIEATNGKFTKYTLGNGLSRVGLGGDGDLGSCGDSLAYSDGYGRVVILDAEGVATKFSAKQHIETITNKYKLKINKAKEIRDKALSDLEKL